MKTRYVKAETADEAYRKHVGGLRARIALLSQCIESHAKRRGTDDLNWGWVGDVSEASHLIDQAIKALGL